MTLILIRRKHVSIAIVQDKSQQLNVRLYNRQLFIDTGNIENCRIKSVEK